MGNQSGTMCCDKQQKQKHHLGLSKLSNVFKTPSQDNETCTRRNDNFIIKHIQNNRDNDNDIVQSTLDQRRLVFVSLIGLYFSWKLVPSVSLYTSLLIIPLKKVWIYKPIRYINELKEAFLSQITIFGDINETNIRDFIELLKWKDSQKLVMWILDYFDEFEDEIQLKSTAKNTRKNKDINPLIASFWYCLNDKLCSLYDHITRKNYTPLYFDEKWWKNKETFVSKYGTKYPEILSEYYFVTMKYNTISEIIYQSNPKSLHPVISYRNRSNTKCLSPINTQSAGQTVFGFNVHKIRVISPLSPIKEKHKNNGSTSVVSVDEEKNGVNIWDNQSPYLQIIHSGDSEK